MGSFDEFLEILFRAEARIDIKEAGCVVAMIRWAGKDRREPQTVRSEFSDVIELFNDAA